MRIALLTNAWYPDGDPGYLKYTDLLKRVWCKRHGWDFLRTAWRRCAPNRPEWEKLPCVDDALASGYDWVVWMDADAAPVGMDVDIDSYLEWLSDVFVSADDANGINTGVFAVDQGKRNRRLLNTVKALMGDPRYNGGFYEQTAFSDVLQLPPFSAQQLEPPADIGWQAYPDLVAVGRSIGLYRPGAWCVHCPGRPDICRLDVFRSMALEYADNSDE